MTKSSATALSYSTLGQVIPYVITATNTGNVTPERRSSVSDTNATLGSCDAQPSRWRVLAPGPSVSCSRHPHRDPGRPRRGQHHQRRPRATGQPTGRRGPGHGTRTCWSSTSAQSPAITLDKTADTAGLRRRRHAGHLQLSGHQQRQRDPQPGASRHRPLMEVAASSSIDCARPPARLGPARSQRRCRRHLHHDGGRRRQAGSINNTGTATGTPPRTSRTTSPVSDHLLGHHSGHPDPRH